MRSVYANDPWGLTQMMSYGRLNPGSTRCALIGEQEVGSFIMEGGVS